MNKPVHFGRSPDSSPHPSRTLHTPYEHVRIMCEPYLGRTGVGMNERTSSLRTVTKTGIPSPRMRQGGGVAGGGGGGGGGIKKGKNPTGQIIPTKVPERRFIKPPSSRIPHTTPDHTHPVQSTETKAPSNETSGTQNDLSPILKNGVADLLSRSQAQNELVTGMIHRLKKKWNPSENGETVSSPRATKGSSSRSLASPSEEKETVPPSEERETNSESGESNELYRVRRQLSQAEMCWTAKVKPLEAELRTANEEKAVLVAEVQELELRLKEGAAEAAEVLSKALLRQEILAEEVRECRAKLTELGVDEDDTVTHGSSINDDEAFADVVESVMRKARTEDPAHLEEQLCPPSQRFSVEEWDGAVNEALIRDETLALAEAENLRLIAQVQRLTLELEQVAPARAKEVEREADKLSMTARSERDRLESEVSTLKAQHTVLSKKVKNLQFEVGAEGHDLGSLRTRARELQMQLNKEQLMKDEALAQTEVQKKLMTDDAEKLRAERDKEGHLLKKLAAIEEKITALTAENELLKEKIHTQDESIRSAPSSTHSAADSDIQELKAELEYRDRILTAIQAEGKKKKKTKKHNCVIS